MLRPSGPGAAVLCHLLKRAYQVSMVRHRLHRHRRQGYFERVSRLRHRVPGRGCGLARLCTGNGPLRAVGCLGKQISLACLFAGRGRLPSPRVARGWDRLSTAFRYYATIRLLSSHRHLVVGSSMTTAIAAEAERSPRVSTQNFVPTPSPIRPPARRIWASLPLASSPQVRTPLTALRFRSVRYCIIRLLPDAPSRVLRSCERPCLVDGGFPPSGPQEDLTTTCLTSLFCVHAEHTKALRPPAAVRSAQP